MGGHFAHHRTANRHNLTPRQREVLDLIAAGCTNPEIADRLGISLEGAKHHVSEILSRLDVVSREEAAAWWRVHRGSRLTRSVQALWPWPAAGAATTIAIAIGAVGFALWAGLLDFTYERADVDETATADLQTCRRSEVVLEQSRGEDGAIYFSALASSPQAPCAVAGSVSLVPVPARVDRQPNVDIGIRGNFSRDVVATVQPGGTVVMVIRWSNWCQDPMAIAWRTLSALPGSATGGSGPLVSDSSPLCEDTAAPSTLGRVDATPRAQRDDSHKATACTAEDLRFALYAGSPWRPQPAFVEVQPSAVRPCEVHDDLAVTLVVDGVAVGTAVIRFDTQLDTVGLRAPFRWSGPCSAGDALLQVALGPGRATLNVTVRPLCDPPTAVASFAAGWP